MKAEHIATIFKYHPPHGDQGARYDRLRAAGGELALLICELCPESGERVLAIRRVQEAVMYANASIACNERAPRQCALCGSDVKSNQEFETLGDGSVAHGPCLDRRGR